MRICSPQLGLSPKSVLGGEVYDREILMGLARKGVTIDIVLPNNLNYDRNVKNWQVTMLLVSHFPAVFFNFFLIPYLFLIYQKTKFQVIRLHSPQFIGFGALFFKIFAPKVKIVATYHQFRESRLFGLGKILNKRWDYIITDSKYVESKIIKTYNIEKSKISAIHNGVPSYLKPAKKSESLLKKYNLDNKLVLLFMGLFIDRKNPLFLLDVVGLIKSDNIVVLFWGMGPLKKDIINKSKKMGIYNKIRIVEPVYGLGKNKIHNLADIFVHPSIDEGFALAPLESMACAKPVVITKGHSAAEAVDNNVNGYLCNLNDPKDWAKKLSELIKNPQLRNKMGYASLKKVKAEFQWGISVEKHLKILKGQVNETN